MPLRIALTGCMQGPDVGAQLSMLALAPGALAPSTNVVDLPARIAQLKAARGL